MKSYIKFIAVLLLLLCPAVMLAADVGSAGSGTESAGIVPSSYPVIGGEEMGQLRWVLQLADQPLDDYSHMEGIDQLGMTSYRYCIAFMTYFLALEQYYKLPACAGIIQPRMDRLIRKMLEKPVWEFWAGVSVGVPALEPGLDKPYPEERDPVAYRNIMYSGHVGHMIGLYETLYHDLKWDEPGSIVFEWSPEERYVYDYLSLNQVMHDQMNNHQNHCVECEPNACFPECNQHPILSFMLSDHVHGTDLAAVSAKFLDFFLAEKMIDPDSHETAMLYLVKQGVTLSRKSPRYKNALDLVVTPAVSLGIVSIESASADGWTATFMHGWQPAYIERQYPYMRENNLVSERENTARLARTIWEPQLKYGFFAMLAAEVGDFETRDKLIRYADEKYQPAWEDGTMHYEYSNARGCTNLTGKLLAFARANQKDGVWKMHNRPFDARHFSEPVVVDVEFPKVLLRRAVYDREKGALVVTTEPGTGKGETILTIERLDPARSYTLFVDGQEAGKYRDTDTAAVTVMLDGRHDVVLATDY